MPRGLPRSYIERARRELPRGASISRIFRRAWKLYKGSKVYSALSGRRKTSRKTRRSVRRRMPRRRYYTRRRRRRGSLTIPLAPTIGLLAGLDTTINQALKGDWQGAIRELAYRYAGYDTAVKNFDINRMKQGLLPLAVGLLVHKFVGGWPLNFNKMLARHKIPFIRI